LVDLAGSWLADWLTGWLAGAAGPTLPWRKGKNAMFSLRIQKPLSGIKKYLKEFNLPHCRVSNSSF